MDSELGATCSSCDQFQVEKPDFKSGRLHDVEVSYPPLTNVVLRSASCTLHASCRYFARLEVSQAT